MTYAPRKLPPRPANRSKIVTRDFGPAGVKEEKHTSFRLEPELKQLIRLLAARKYGGVSMTAVIRILVYEEAKREGLIQ